MRHYVSIAEGLKSFTPGPKHNLAIWDGRLSNEDIDAISRGVEPRTVRPEVLLMFAPIWDSEAVPSVVPTDGVVTISVWGDA